MPASSCAFRSTRRRGWPSRSIRVRCSPFPNRQDIHVDLGRSQPLARQHLSVCLNLATRLIEKIGSGLASVFQHRTPTQILEDQLEVSTIVELEVELLEVEAGAVR